MRKLLNTLFVTSEDKYLALENQNVVVWNGDERVAQYPLVMLEGIVSFSYKGASPALMGACAERNILLSFFTRRCLPYRPKHDIWEGIQHPLDPRTRLAGSCHARGRGGLEASVHPYGGTASQH